MAFTICLAQYFKKWWPRCHCIALLRQVVVIVVEADIQFCSLLCSSPASSITALRCISLLCTRWRTHLYSAVVVIIAFVRHNIRFDPISLRQLPPPPLRHWPPYVHVFEGCVKVKCVSLCSFVCTCVCMYACMCVCAKLLTHCHVAYSPTCRCRSLTVVAQLLASRIETVFAKTIFIRC